MILPHLRVRLSSRQCHIHPDNRRHLGITTSDGDLGSGAQSMCFSDDGINWSAWEPISESREWQLKSGQGYKTLYLRLRDRANNISMLPITDTIALKPNALAVDREGSGEVKALLASNI